MLQAGLQPSHSLNIVIAAAVVVSQKIGSEVDVQVNRIYGTDICLGGRFAAILGILRDQNALILCVTRTLRVWSHQIRRNDLLRIAEDHGAPWRQNGNRVDLDSKHDLGRAE